MSARRHPLELGEECRRADIPLLAENDLEIWIGEGWLQVCDITEHEVEISHGRAWAIIVGAPTIGWSKFRFQEGTSP